MSKMAEHWRDVCTAECIRRIQNAYCRVLTPDRSRAKTKWKKVAAMAQTLTKVFYS